MNGFQLSGAIFLYPEVEYVVPSPDPKIFENSYSTATKQAEYVAQRMIVDR